MPERTFVPPDYYKGSSDYPESKKHRTVWLSQDWGPEKTAIIRESLINWEKAREMRDAKKAEMFQDEISEELGEELDAQDLKELLSDLRGEKVKSNEDEEESEEEEMEKSWPEKGRKAGAEEIKIEKIKKPELYKTKSVVKHHHKRGRN